MKTRLALGIGLLVILLNTGVLIWQITREPKVAYVRSNELVYGYFGMKEAMEHFRMEEGERQRDLDTLRADLQHAIILARQFAAQKDSDQFERQNQTVSKKQAELIQHTDVVQQRSKEAEQEILSGVLSQINAFVASYAQEKGYDIILGTTTDGSLLYGKEGLDITEDVLLALNKHHDGL